MVSEKGKIWHTVIQTVLERDWQFSNDPVSKIGAYDQQIWEKSLEQTELKVMWQSGSLCLYHCVKCMQSDCETLFRMTGLWKQT